MGSSGDASECLDEDLAARLVDGAVSSDERERAVAHVSGCDECRRWLASLARLDDSQPTPSLSPVDPGDPFTGVTLGRYHLTERLGAGSTGLVYRARDPVLDREVAVKLVRHLDDPAMRRQLVAEARTMAKISHPNVVPVFDAGDEGDELFIASALVEGGDLRARLGSFEDVPNLLLQFAGLADGLFAIHDAGFIHRDIKPDNILVDPRGHLLLADMGVRGTTFRSSGASSGPPGATTEVYEAPEQREDGTASPASDQYSLALTLVEAVLGTRPSLESSDWRHELRRRGVHGTAVLAVARALEREPRARFESMQEFAAALRRPGPIARRRIAIAIGGAITFASALWVVRTTIADRNRDDGCDRAVARADHWTSEPARAVRSLRLDGQPTTIGQTVETRIAGFASAWKAQYRTACRESISGQAGAHARLACLEDRAVQMEGFIAALREVSTDALARADQAVWIVAPVEGCSGAATSWAPPTPPPDQAGRIAELNLELAIARADYWLSDLESSRRRALAVEEAADALGYSPLLAEARYTLGAAAFAKGQRNDALGLFAAAEVLADRSGHDRLRAQALAAQLSVPELTLENGRVAVTRLDPLLQRFASDGALLSQLHQSRGEFWARNGHYEEALTELNQAIAALDPLADAGNRQRAGVEADLGTASMYLGRKDEATNHYQRAIEIYRAYLPADSPSIARAKMSLATVIGGQRALELVDDGIAILRSRFGDAHPDTLQALTNACSMRSAQKAPAAVERCREAVAAAEALFGPTSSELVWPLTALGQGLLGAKQAAEALQVLERALVLANPDLVLEYADLQYYLAGALAMTRRSPARALELAQASRKVWSNEPMRQPALQGVDELIAELEGRLR